jgi:hypothetical protein
MSFTMRPLWLGHQGLDQALVVVPETFDGCRIVALHKARITNHVGRENRSEASFGPSVTHPVALQPSSRATFTLAGRDQQA